MPARFSFAPFCRLACCLFFALSLSACSGAKQSATAGAEPIFQPDGKGGFTFDGRHMTQRAYPGLKNVTKVSLLKEAGVQLFVNYPEGIGEKADTVIQRKVASLAGAFVLSVMPTPEYMEEEAALDEKDEAAALFHSRVYPGMIDYEVTETGGGALSVRFCVWNYHGGAHDNWTYHALSLERDSGEAISLKRLFAGPKSVERTARWLTEQNEKMRREAERSPNPLSRDLLHIEVAPEEINMGRIALTPEGLSIRFDPYEKASFADGDVTLLVPKSEFKRLGINAAFWK